MASSLSHNGKLNQVILWNNGFISFNTRNKGIKRETERYRCFEQKNKITFKE